MLGKGRKSVPWRTGWTMKGLLNHVLTPAHDNVLQGVAAKTKTSKQKTLGHKKATIPPHSQGGILGIV